MAVKKKITEVEALLSIGEAINRLAIAVEKLSKVPEPVTPPPIPSSHQEEHP
jgi:hypothetical protein